MDDIYLLWIREEGAEWEIFGYTKDGQKAITWKGNAKPGIHRRYERVYGCDI